MKWFADLSLSRKLLIGFSVITIIVVTQGGFSYFVSKNLGDVSTNIYRENLIPIKRISKINPLFYQYRWEMLLLVDSLVSDDILEQIEVVEEKNSEIDSFIEKSQFKSISEERKELVSLWENVKSNLNKLKKLLQDPSFDDQEAFDFIYQGKLSLDKAITLNENIVQKLELEAQNSFNSALRIQDDSNKNIIFIISLGVLISIGLAVFISRLIVNPVSLLMNSTIAINKGNLDEEVQVKYDDEVGTLAKSFDQMRLSIKKKISDLAEVNAIVEEQNRNLERKVAERTEEIKEILNAIQQGIVTMNPDFTLNREHSLQAEYIFNTKDFDHKSIFDLMQLSDKKIDTFKKWYKFVSHPNNIHRWHKYSKLAPREINLTASQGTKIVRFNYQPLLKDNKLEKVMVLAEDVTLIKHIEAEREKEKRAHEHQINTIRAIIVHHKDSLDSFIEYADRVINTISSYDSEKLNKFYTATYRDIHTLKGNGGSLGFRTFARILHEAENLLSTKKDELLTDDEDVCSEWKSQIKEAKEELEYIVDTKMSLFPNQKNKGFFVDHSKFESIILDLYHRDQFEKKEVLEKIQKLNSETFELLIAKHQKLAVQIAEKLKKDLKEPVILSADKLIHRELFKYFDGSLVHIVRNAIDHGLETKEERKEIDKGGGEIRFDLLSKKDFVGVSVEDNGKGIDLEKVSQRALEKEVFTAEQIAGMSESEKMGIIFTPGFSSANEVTDISGRGVGMDAVKTDIEGLGGTVEIQSEVGVFTKITLWLPEDIHLQHLLKQG